MAFNISGLTTENQITALYVGYFGRSPDGIGLTVWRNQLEEHLDGDADGDPGRDLEEIGTLFSTSQESQNEYEYFAKLEDGIPGNESRVDAAAFINEIYLNLFGRDAEEGGLLNWTNHLVNGTFTAGEIIIAIMEGAGPGDQTRLENKIEVALDFHDEAVANGVNNFPEGSEAKELSKTILEGVNIDPASVEAAKQTADAFFSEGQTFTLTKETDAGPAFAGGEDDDVYDASLAPAIDGLVGAQTLQGSDVLDGGDGVDTLNAELNGTGATQNPTISDIEVYNLTSFAGPLGIGNGTLDLDRATGYQQLWNRNSRVDLDLGNVGEVATLGLDNVRDGSEYNVMYDNIAVAEQNVVSMMSGRPGDRVRLDIDGVAGAIGIMNLIVSDDNYLTLQDDADDILNLNISGDGILDIEGDDDFSNIQTLDTLDYVGDVNLDVSGSVDLESVETADGDDTVVVDHAAVNGGFSADMGAGFDILNIDGASDETELNAIDFSGGVTGVENIAFDDAIDLTGDAVLDLDGVSDDLETVWFFDGFDADGNDLAIENSPVADLNINTIADVADDADFDMDSGLLTVDGVVNLTIDAADDADVDGGLNGDVLETLVMNAGDDLDLDLFDGLDALVSIEANATNTSTSTGGDSDANVNLDASAGAIGDPTEFDALKTVNVNAASNATLTMTGRAGVPFFAGTQATQSFTIDVSGAGGFPFTASGNVFFTSGDLPSGFVDTNYSTNLFDLNYADNNAAGDIASDLDALPELEASSGFFSNVANVTWADVGVVDQLAYQAGSSGATSGTLNSVTTGAFTQGQEAIAQVDGEGFVAVETVTVDAQDGDADVDLTDVYGLFTLEVTATDDANVNLFNTNATSATVAAGSDLGDEATVTVDGDTVGNAELVDLTVSGDEADVTLLDNLESFTTLNVSGVATEVDADTSGAEFGVSGGQFVEYQIGATSDGVDGTVDVDFIGNDAREVYNFTGDDIGEVVITDFTVGADPTSGDRLDISGFAANSGQLVFTDDGADLVITDLSGGLDDFGGSITIVGAAGQEADMSSFNIIYG